MSTLNLIKEIKTNNTSIELYNLKTEISKKYIKDILTQLKDTFTKLKIKYIVGEFYGGHDEGGFDNTYFENDEGELITISEEEKNSFKKWVDV